MNQRKIISGAVLLLAGLLVTFVVGDIPDNLLSLMQWLYLAFVAGNAVEHIKQVFIKDKITKEKK